jgi:hypothetical protein
MRKYQEQKHKSQFYSWFLQFGNVEREKLFDPRRPEQV